MGQKIVKFSDLSGELITDDRAVARVVIHEHPELAGAPVEIEVLADEARAVGKAAVRVAVVDLYLPGEDEPQHMAVDLDAFDKLATDKPMSELLITARPARKASKPREKRAASEEPGARDGAAGRGSRSATPAGTGSAAQANAGGSGKTKTAAAAASTAKSSTPPASAASLAAAGLAEAVA